MIAVDSPRGDLVTHVPAGRYVLTVDDRSPLLDFHFFGPGIDKRTTVVGVGTVRWRIDLRRGLYHYQCDAHATFVRGVLHVT